MNNQSGFPEERKLTWWNYYQEREDMVFNEALSLCTQAHLKIVGEKDKRIKELEEGLGKAMETGGV